MSQTLFATKKPIVSILLAVYNGGFFLKDQILSICAQTLADFELIIVDDGSSDESLKIAKALADQDHRIRVYQNSSNLGVVKNFLSALKYAQADLICFSDQDDYWAKDKLQKLNKLIKKDAKNILAYSDLEVCDENLNTLHASFWKASSIAPFNGAFDERGILKNIIPGCSMMFRSIVKEKIFGFGENSPFMHDHLVFLISSLMGKIVFSDEKLLKYRQHSSNSIGVKAKQPFDKDEFASDLKRKSAFLKLEPTFNFKFNFEKVTKFCDLYSQKKFWQICYLGSLSYLTQHLRVF